MIAYLLLMTLGPGFVLYKSVKRIYEFYVFVQKLDKIPGPSFLLPFWGMPLKLTFVEREDYLDWRSDFAKQYKDGFFRVWLGTTGQIDICKPEHIQVLLRSTVELNKSPVFGYMQAWLGNGIVVSDSSGWHRARKLISPAFHSKFLAGYAEVMVEKVNALMKRIERELEIHGDRPLDVEKLSNKFALDIISDVLIGPESGFQEERKREWCTAVRTITTAFNMRITRPWLSSEFLFRRTALGKQCRDSMQIARDIFAREIERKFLQSKQAKDGVSEENNTQGETRRKPMFDLIVDTSERQGDVMTKKEMGDHINTILMAGYDTSTSLTAWTIFCVGVELDVQRKLHEELDEIIADADDQTTLKRIPKLKYLDRVMKEVLRLYPTVTDIGRTLINDMKIGEYTIPKGTVVNMQIYQLHRDPSIWPDPLRFDPDRFLPENVGNRHPFAFIPFSSGLRSCMGKKFAMLESKLAVVQILRKFKIKSVESHPTMKKFSAVSLKSVGGILVHLTTKNDR